MSHSVKLYSGQEQQLNDRANGAAGVVRPTEERRESGNRNAAFAKVLEGEENRWWEQDRPLIEQAAKTDPSKIQESAPGGLFAKRVAERLREAGGYGKQTGKLAVLVHLVESGMLLETKGKRVRQLCREALGAGSFDSILLDAQHKRLMKGFMLRKTQWAKIPSLRKAVVDFKNQYAIQTGSMPIFGSVPAQSPYPEVQFADDRANYTVAKYGGIYGVSLESQLNDDMGVLGAVAEKFGGGFAQTLDDFVFSTQIDDNPTIYDAVALFHNGSHANDLGASKALTHDTLEEAVVKLTSQTDPGGQPMDQRPWALIVHPAQEFTAERLLNSELRPGTQNNDKNAFRGKFPGGVIVSSRVTSGRWYVMADPSQEETIELGFLGGREEPELFQEGKDGGRAFEFEEIRWKARMIFGGVPINWRWIVRANV